MINFSRLRPLIRRAFSRRTGYLDRPICGKVCLPAGTKQDAATLLYVKKLNGRAAFRLQGDTLWQNFTFKSLRYENSTASASSSWPRFWAWRHRPSANGKPASPFLILPCCHSCPGYSAYPWMN